MKNLYFFWALLAFVTVTLASPSRFKPKENFDCNGPFPDQVACPASCSPANNCACFASEPQIPLNQRPQIVYLTYDDGFTALAHQNYYEQFFQGQYKNPNNCSIRSTHFLTHLSSDYTLINKYYNEGHEMAVHSITHRSNTTYWRTLSENDWVKEMVGMREIINQFAKVPEDQIKGLRVPYLQIGGDEQYAMMANNKFVYDCSRPSLEYGHDSLNIGVWPYTLDYKDDIDCQIEPCPQCSFPGIWTQPMLDLKGYDDVPCAMLDSCTGTTFASEVFEMLKSNFDLSYTGTTKAPIGLYVHAAWFFGGDFRFEGYKRFLDYITGFDDVWIVPVRAGIEYIKNPKTNQQLIDGDLPAFRCDPPPQVDCTATKNCPFQVDNEDIHGEVYMKICGTRCPPKYPWLGNPTGT